MAVQRRQGPTMRIDKFLGLGNYGTRTEMGEAYLETANNVDLGSGGDLHTRRGYELLAPGTSARSIYCPDNWDFMLYADETDLNMVSPEGAVTTLISDIGYGPVQYSDYQGYCYLATDTGTWRVTPSGDVYPWGTPVPLGLTDGTGDCGISAAFSFVRASTGVEGGLSSQIRVSANSSVTIQKPDDIEFIRIYTTAVNGSELHLQEEYAVPVTAGAVVVPIRGGAVSGPAPYAPDGIPPRYPVTVQATFKDRILSAKGQDLYYTDRYAPELIHRIKGFIQYEGRITNICPMHTGCYVIADGIYWHRGSDIDDWRQERVTYVRGVPGTDVKIIGSDIEIDSIPPGDKYLVTTDRGVFLLADQGVAYNLTERNYLMDTPVDDNTKGAAMLRLDDGRIQYVASHIQPVDSNPGGGERSALSDLAEATVIRAANIG